eukprot:gene5070-730_t
MGGPSLHEDEAPFAAAAAAPEVSELWEELSGSEAVSDALSAAATSD